MLITEKKLRNIIRKNLLTEAAPIALGAWITQQVAIMVLGYAAGKAVKSATANSYGSFIKSKLENKDWVVINIEKFSALSEQALSCKDKALGLELDKFREAGIALARITQSASFLPDNLDTFATSIESMFVGTTVIGTLKTPTSRTGGAGLGIQVHPKYLSKLGGALSKSVPLISGVALALDVYDTVSAVNDAYKVDLGKFNNDLQGFDNLYEQLKSNGGKLPCVPADGIIRNNQIVKK